MNKSLITLALLAGAALPGQAADFGGATGPVVAQDYSADGLISFDLDFLSRGSATLTYSLTAADLGGSGLAFNAVLRNLANVGFTGDSLGLSTGSFDPVGTATRQFGGGARVSFEGAVAAVRFDTPEFLDVELGDPLTSGLNQVDWALSGLNAGDSLRITVSAVPEPETYAMMLAGLVMMGWMARRRSA